MAINAALLAGLAVVGIVLFSGIRSLRDDVTSAASEYAELRLIEEAMFHTSLATTSLDAESLDLSSARGHVQRALQQLQSFSTFQDTEEVANSEHQEQEQAEQVRAARALTSLLDWISVASTGSATIDEAGGEALATAALMALSRLAVQTDIADVNASTAELTVTTLILVGALAALLVAGAIVATIVYYRSVMVPLRLLHSGVRRVAEGEFTERLPEEGTQEFAELSTDFNEMADKLSALYHTLEEQVKQKSRELVQSERLASVGFLAAGVAHEINNPLGVMSGYAELAQRWMMDPSPSHLDEVRSALDVIRSEGFRCKAITDRLLSLARIGNAARSDVSLPTLATEVADMLRGLRKYDDRQLVLRFARSASATIHGNADELKQVILNVLVNAFEAVKPGTGKVMLMGERRNGSVALVVEDNGCGMSSATLERAFEPFFTARVGQDVRGTGLGLSISRSIVESHGGTIRAESDGPGRGSRFIIELPVLSEQTPRGS